MKLLGSTKGKITKDANAEHAPHLDFYSKRDKIRRKMRICSNLLKNSLMENFKNVLFKYQQE